MLFLGKQIFGHLSIGLMIALLSPNAIIPVLAEEAENSSSFNSNKTTFSLNQIWNRGNDLHLDNRYQIQSQIILEESIDWNNTEVGITPKIQIDFHTSQNTKTQ